MRKLALLVILCSANAFTEGRAGREVIYTLISNVVPTLDKGYLIEYPGVPSADVTLVRPDGTLAYTARVVPPDGAGVIVGNGAVDRDGTLAVGVGYEGPDGFAGGIAWFDSGGKQIRFVSTGRYVPSQLSFGADRSLWAIGGQRDAVLRHHADSQDYMIFRKYSPEGKEVGAYLPRSAFPRGLEPGSCGHGSWHLRVAKDRVGALMRSGKTSLNPEWVELDLSGNLIGRWNVDSLTRLQGEAFTESGNLYALVCQEDNFTLRVLNRKTGGFDAVDFDVPSGLGFLLGADGDNLVFHFQTPGRFRWVATTQ